MRANPSTIAADLRCLSLLFSYPDAGWALQPAPAASGVRAAALLARMRAVDSIVLQSEYVRLYINAMPTLPCPPYGSVHLEGSVMGRTTVEVAACYRKYGLVCEEAADHIAVECEFLALLHRCADRDAETAADCRLLADHLQSWADTFFDLVDRHDTLGIYREAAAFGRSVVAAAGGGADRFETADPSLQ
ncbi:molecular chaperone TorD family protein [Desulfoprunum benzoelyticum]|uniref:TorA maturation chaperone TorD n=1 Tax=Desulfoprunum benzoelyticum TaxID=1506996 RepID=A0A840UW53_9BACT|nr:molecular chaperone TorD family protein [Desulfoprunum benzoelyticum]MBB5349103.1 TorA maturation chaperone TorD [Desulfoprunum benzoelyticum]MBM9530658.1 molecular chaperone TorD family protein [Desulfoprunum benzoelyticum]